MPFSPQASPSNQRGAAAKEERPATVDPAKVKVGNLVDEIIGGVNVNTAHGKAEREVWKRAQKAHGELRDKLVEHGFGSSSPSAMMRSDTGMSESEQKQSQLKANCFSHQKPHSCATAVTSSLLFPGDWWRTLSAEPLAALVVDSFASAFCDALIDGLVLTLEEKEGWARPCSAPSALGASASAPSLPLMEKAYAHSGSPQLGGTGRLDLTSPAAGLAGLPRRGGLESYSGGSRSTIGFAQAGRQPADTLAAWSTNRFHACPKLDPYTRRVQKAAELHRPRRRVLASAGGAAAERDERKFVWPMSRSNFPDEFDEATKRKQQGTVMGHAASDRRSLASTAASATEGPDWIIGTDHNGKTKFPYSLALHKAFLESQVKPELRAKAQQIAPLRITTAEFY